MRSIVSAILLVTMCMTMAGQDIDAFVNGLLQQYPRARLLDVYKSCFQDYMGAEHLVGDTAAVQAYLEQELEATTATAMQPWYQEPCGIEGRHVRVSLRAVHEGWVPAGVLLNAFIASAGGDDCPPAATWARRWHDIVAVIDGMALDLPHYQQDKQFIEQVLQRGQYAISHSPDYREAYSPHYRIVRRDIFERDIAPLLPRCCCE